MNIILLIICIWLFLGLISVFLGWIIFSNADEEPIKFSAILLHVILGIISLFFMLMEISDEQTHKIY